MCSGQDGHLPVTSVLDRLGVFLGCLCRPDLGSAVDSCVCKVGNLGGS